MFYLGTGRYAEALVQAERAVALDPRSAAATAELARALLANDRYDEALDRLKPIMALEPPLLRVPVIAAECYGRKKQWDQAISILAVPATQDPGSAAVYGYMLARAGKRAVADSVHQALKARWERGEIHALFLAVVPMARGDKDEAFSWLERALQDGSFRFRNGIALGAFDPLFNDLKPDPRLEDLRRRALHQKR
jgi:tetratricopeptide (TPR) repeat protein